MAIASGQLIQTRPTSNAQTLVNSFQDRNVSAAGSGNYNNNISFALTQLPNQTVPVSVRASSDAYYQTYFAGTTAGVTPGLTDNDFPTNPDLVRASDGSYLGVTGYASVFLQETNRYNVFRNIQATTIVTGNIPPRGTYTETGKGYVSAAYQPGVITGNISNPSSASNLAAARVVSADTNGMIGGESATALNSYWDDLKTAWATLLSNSGTLTLGTTICHGSCHSSCHGSRGRR